VIMSIGLFWVFWVAFQLLVLTQGFNAAYHVSSRVRSDSRYSGVLIDDDVGSHLTPLGYHSIAEPHNNVQSLWPCVSTRIPCPLVAYIPYSHSTIIISRDGSQLRRPRRLTAIKSRRCSAVPSRVQSMRRADQSGSGSGCLATRTVPDIELEVEEKGWGTRGGCGGGC
jgi:hypothetical protein